MCVINVISDKIETIANGTCIQHGKLNNRIYLMKLDSRDIPQVFTLMHQIVKEEWYSKIICKIPKKYAPVFFANGFILEAQIPKFYKGQDDAFFVSKFLSSDRVLKIERDKLSAFSAILSKEQPIITSSPTKFTIRELNQSDVSKITDIYSKVFETYPFPIHEKEYVLQTMSENVRYFGAEKNGELAAIASSEMDLENKNAEMTDFATYPKYSGNRLASALLRRMEQEMKHNGIHTLYTIARLKSIPMNLTFIRMNYNYTGTLIKNTNISGDIESMNVYYKQI
ncbi:putative beta-lysine N-acetyltransferase [Plebeiibacterium sediminum]|uniref:Beta-lysine N-acetyltransferase n=1 Tax=Plebeiibacterium sediminum TaxID=2992112 RepID=A0AAE3M3N0_9BACT|nr:putative beta-lysine N-acetyltransferase [Plebeiobacterium sediminum]MCW3786469.1 putative beta-lysine N-acetyltransferase [Plebeiobacterium sediminum]